TSLLFLFFFSTISPSLPLSTLFPYTTLFRSFFNIIVLNNALLLNHNSFYQMEYLSHCFSTIASWQRFFLIIPPHLVLPSCPLTRSEEHTSELQSRFDLVCRLLLEKKKK